ncbi:hypothetical protein LCGC14_1874710 [marine sediment metagenome]|uniref:Uncharacterized protein n=1 Tax=marine sediment metagenome TaxID=412755 RepID=A0A0F9G454_9ZZZZ
MTAKKIKREINKLVHKEWREFYDSIFTMPFRDRLRLAWALVTYRKPKSKTDRVWSQRRAVQ